MPAPSYAAIVVYPPGKSDPSLMCHEGKVVVFDHALMARQFLPLIGGGRITHWLDEDCVCWLTLDENGGPNRAMIVTDYDLYNLPPQHPVPSETKLMAWKHHIMWGEWLSTPDSK